MERASENETLSNAEPPQRWPTVGSPNLPPIPDLPKIPRERWRAVLEQTHPSVRQYAIRTARVVDLAAGALADRLVVEIQRVERAARERHAAAAQSPQPVPTPRASRERRRRYSRQIGFRLTPDEHADLARAAETLSLRPAQVARMLVVRGVHQVLREAEREVG